MTITSQAPARVDWAGGTLDIWPLYLYHENSQTVNFAIDAYARCYAQARGDGHIVVRSRDLRVSETFASLGALKQALEEAAQRRAESSRASSRRRAGKVKLALPALLIREFASLTGAGKFRGLTLEMHSGVPAGSGLGGSSALNIAICGALARFIGRRLAPSKLIEIARNVESQVLRVPAGEQDYYSAMFGGLQAIHLTAHGIEPERLPVAAQKLNERFVLCYTGQSRHSGINNWEVEKAHIDGKAGVIRHFASIASIAADLRHALLEHDWNAAARLVNADWQARKKSWPGITTRQIDRLIDIAKRHGALAGKACGAGGGGCVAFMVEAGAKAKVASAISAAGVHVLPARLAMAGLKVGE